MLSDIDFKKIYWASRRGMLELDLLLVPFVEQRLRQLDDHDQARYRQLLDCEDNDLFSWLLRREPVPDPELAPIVDQILAHAIKH